LQVDVVFFARLCFFSHFDAARFVDIAKSSDNDKSSVRVGRSSMTVTVDMIREDLISGARRPAVRGTFEMVAVNEFGRPVPIAQPVMTDPILKEAIS